MEICSRHGWYEQLRVTQQIDNVKTTSIQCRIDVVSLLCAYWLEAMLDQDRCICKQCRCRWIVTFFMLNSAEHEIFYANKSQITDNDQDRFMYLQTVQMQMDRYICSCSTQLSMKFFMLINLKLLTMIKIDLCIYKQCRCRWIVTFFMLISAEHEIFHAYKSQITDNDQDRFMYLQTVQMQMDRYIFHAHLSWAWNFSC